MQPVPVDLILHALAENLIGMEGNDESLRTLGHFILNTCVDPRALPAQWCNGAGVGQQMSWLTRRIVDGDTHPHVAAETRAMEVAIARRLADTALSLLVTQDDSDKTAALTLLEAAHRVVGLPGAEVHADDTASWQSRVLALEGQLKAAVDLKDSFARDCANLAMQWDSLHAQRLIGIKREDLNALKAERDALQVKLTEALAEAAAHFEDVKTARDEADALRQRVGQLDAVIETNKRLQQSVQSLRETLKFDNTPKPVTERITWIARFNNGNGGASITLDGRTVLVTGKMADDLAEALHPRRQHVADLKDKIKTMETREVIDDGVRKEFAAWSAWAERTSGRHNPTQHHARQVIERRIGDMAAVRDALKLDRDASHEDIIEAIKSLQADRATTVEVPVKAPRFKVGDRVLATSFGFNTRYATVQDNDAERLCLVIFDDDTEVYISEHRLKDLPKVDP